MSRIEKRTYAERREYMRAYMLTYRKGEKFRDGHDTCPDCEGAKDRRSIRCDKCAVIARRKNARYLTTRAPGHPLANKAGRVYLHRYVLHEAGVEVPLDAHVHHRNGDTHDTRIENLEVLSPSDHLRRHGKNLTPAQVAGLRLGGIVSAQKRRARAGRA